MGGLKITKESAFFYTGQQTVSSSLTNY